MAVRGFIFSSDVALFMAVLAISSVLVAHFTSAVVDTVSSQNRIYQAKSDAEHAINVLLFAAKEEFRCMYGENNIPVPGCVWGNGSIDSSWFWVTKRLHCFVNTTNATATTFLQNTLDCKDPVDPDANIVVAVPFTFCWAGNVTGPPWQNKANAIRNCTWVDANLWVWN